MNIPAETKPALLGAALGAVVVAIAGFSWGGWTTSGKAETLAVTRSEDAVVAALAPMCVDRFERDSQATAKRAALKLEQTWSQGDFVEKEGFALFGKTSTPARVSAVARACAVLLVAG